MNKEYKYIRKLKRIMGKAYNDNIVRRLGSGTPISVVINEHLKTVAE